MRTVHDLNQEELEELRSRYFIQLIDEEVLGGTDNEEGIDMENVKTYYGATCFVDDDFFCNISQ